MNLWCTLSELKAPSDCSKCAKKHQKYTDKDLFTKNNVLLEGHGERWCQMLWDRIVSLFYLQQQGRQQGFQQLAARSNATLCADRLFVTYNFARSTQTAVFKSLCHSDSTVQLLSSSVS